jgi:hypothetical protein
MGKEHLRVFTVMTKSHDACGVLLISMISLCAKANVSSKVILLEFIDQFHHAQTDKLSS